MAGEPVVTPPLGAPEDVFVDWLELVAFFNEFRTARLDELEAALEEQYEEVDDDEVDDEDGDLGDDGAENIARIDARNERLRESVENEVDLRIQACEGAYPFVLSADAEELELVEDWTDERYATYLTCLLASHVSRQSLLDFEVETGLISRLRNRVFQVVSTYALCGFVDGQAASVGWPREDKATVLETLRRAEMRGAGFQTKDAPGPYTPPQAKDGGIDVIAWRTENVPPPSLFVYGQVASGHNWRGKPVGYFMELLEVNYMEIRPMVERNTATMMPFRVLDEGEWYREHMGHGRILERTRMPKYAFQGLRIVEAGTETDEAGNMPQVTSWVEDFRQAALA
ncbi:hypothetical protein [Leisingera sp. ANG-DT]|uniref:hypothetical protein n=1 Tax=Leisingera sp. ANG-DT TaxID=1577897 RepID=UPI0012698AA5|nr:hypothetical protein [Leisingera sp. ANG-DT]